MPLLSVVKAVIETTIHQISVSSAQMKAHRTWRNIENNSDKRRILDAVAMARLTRQTTGRSLRLLI